jgi:hypothetical protein
MLQMLAGCGHEPVSFLGLGNSATALGSFDMPTALSYVR